MRTFLDRRRHLRQVSTDAEAFLWKQLRGRRFVGFKFRRQHQIGPFIVDFFCAAQGLVVELDGGQHFEPRKQAYDRWRTQCLSERGVRVLRFDNGQVFTAPEAIMQVIADALGFTG
jgi:very-short-patch-repair endonuclease